MLYAELLTGATMDSLDFFSANVSYANLAHSRCAFIEWTEQELASKMHFSVQLKTNKIILNIIINNNGYTIYF